MISEPLNVVEEEQPITPEGSKAHPPSPNGVLDGVGLTSPPGAIQEKELEQVTTPPNLIASSAVSPEDLQPETVPSPTRSDLATQAVEEQEIQVVSDVPLPVLEIDPITPAPVRHTSEVLSSLATRTARLRARVTPPADLEPVRLARDIFHGLMHQGPNMDVFDLMRRAHKAHGALTRHFACNTPALDRALDLINAVELQARYVNNAEV